MLYAQFWGGLAVHTIHLAETLHRRGHRVIVLQFGNPVLNSRNFPARPGLELRTTTLARRPNRVGLREWYHLLHGVHCDVGVLAKSWTQFGNLWLDLAGRLAFGRRFLTIEHLTPPPPPPRTSRRHFGGLVPGVGFSWRMKVLRLKARSLLPAQIVTVSRNIADELIDGFDFPRAKVVPVPNGIDSRRFVPDPAVRTATRQAWRIPENELVFGSVGRLWNPQKGLDIAVDLFARLVSEHPDLRVWFAVVGDGPDRAALEEQARQSGAGDRIRFPGLTERPWEAFAAIDIFLMPSRFEGIGLSLMEAMATECCPVAMGAGGIKEVVNDPTVGWLVPAGDREAYYRAMKAATMASPEERRFMGRLARERVVEHFDAARQYGKLADLIERA